MASARQVARQFQLPASTVRAIDRRYLERWNQSRRKPALRQMGVDEIYVGKKQKFLSVVSNLETGEPLWFGRERKKETLDGFFQTELSARQRRRSNGLPSARSSTTNFTSCSTPTRRSTRCGGPSFFAREDRCVAWSKANAGSC